jgi:hypothetical protein
VGIVLAYLPLILQSEITVMLGGLHCAVPDDLRLAPVSWKYSTANCTTPPVVAGLYNVSMDMQNTSGWGSASITSSFAAGGE